jgi:hypothetical protein
MATYELSDDGSYWWEVDDVSAEAAAEQYVRDLFTEDFCHDSADYEYEFFIRAVGAAQVYRVVGTVEVEVSVDVKLEAA